ncbi:uncharacterized protein [Temnothorax nylanderi]|uniref:uncharacterized protein n=1 Tax=Temnothorax nylanderi TaxID=102681 RepID=UPI003A84BFFE
MQKTWRVKCNWDEPLPDPLAERWEQFRRDLNAAEALSIPRRVIPSETTAKIYLQGFCDASEGAYGACIYVPAVNKNDVITSRLLCSKSRVAPIKPMSIARMELCGAVLLARLMIDTQENLRVPIDGMYAWSDSKVVLWWIRGDVTRWKPFVANRVNDIVELLPAKHWNYVKGTENPADIISRGATLRQLRDSELWWSGPKWLREDLSSTCGGLPDFDPPEIAEEIRVEERKNANVCAMTSSEDSIIQGLIDKLSSLTMIERVLAYCLRYIFNLQKKPGERDLSRLSVSELQTEHYGLVRHVQATKFADEITDIKKNRELRASSKILQLLPFLDEKGVLRAVDSSIRHGRSIEGIP